MTKKRRESRWEYDIDKRRYRYADSGRLVPESRVAGLRDTFIERNKAVIDTLCDRLAGNMTIQSWILEMRARVKDMFTAEYMLGRGGRNAMTSAEWGWIGQKLRVQYEYLQKFGEDIGAGKLSVAQIKARAHLYAEASSQAYERARERAYGMPPSSLPAYPGDGATECLTNCACHWVIREYKDRWECTWSLGDAEHCPDCQNRAAQYNPYVIEKKAS